jgi:hypothetical protein
MGLTRLIKMIGLRLTYVVLHLLSRHNSNLTRENESSSLAKTNVWAHQFGHLGSIKNLS